MFVNTLKLTAPATFPMAHYLIYQSKFTFLVILPGQNNKILIRNQII
jgi:hypothetical protein